MSIKWKPSLQPQCVAGTQAAGLDSKLLSAIKNFFPEFFGSVCADEDFETVFTGITCASPCGIDAVDFSRCIMEGRNFLHPISSHCSKQINSIGTLQRQQAHIFGHIGKLDAFVIADVF